VQIEEKVETKRLASGFGAATVSELTSDLVTINWEEPNDTGGVKIIHYLIVMRETDKTKYKKIAEVDADVHSYTVTKVKEDYEYHFRVYAQNEVGISREAAELATSVKIPKRKKEKKLAEEPSKPVDETAVVVEESTAKDDKTAALVEETTVEIEETATAVVESTAIVEEVADKVEETATVVEEHFEAEVCLPPQKTKDEAETELTLIQKPKEESEAETTTEEESETEEETEKEEEEEKEPVKEPEPEPVTEAAKQPEVGAPVTEPEKPAPVKKQLILEGVKVEEEQFEKVVQEVSEQVQIEEKVETKRLASGFGAATISELTSDSVTINWEEPKDTGGVKIIRYLIVMRESDKTKYKKIAEVDANVHSYTVTKLKEDHEYHFHVYAQNEVGISAEAAELATSVKIPKRKKEKKPTEEPSKPVEEVATVVEETAVKVEETAVEAEEAAVVVEETAVAVEKTDVQAEETTSVVQEAVEVVVSLPVEQTIEEAKTELVLIEKSKEESEAEATAEVETEKKEETKKEVESELEPVKAPEPEAATEPVKEPEVEAPVTEPEKPAPIKKQLILEGVKVEEEQFEKVVQEVSEDVQIEERVETKRLASGFDAATVSELTSDSVTINWEEPNDTGGVKIIRYLIVMRESDKTKYKKIAEVDADVHSYTVTKLKEDHEYHFRVYAQNEVGISTDAAETATSVRIPKRKKEKKEKTEPTPETVEEIVETQTHVESQEHTQEIVTEEEHVVQEVSHLLSAVTITRFLRLIKLLFTVNLLKQYFVDVEYGSIHCLIICL